MSHIVQFYENKYGIVPSGKYEVSLLNIKDKQGQYGSIYVPEFEITKGEYRGSIINAFVPIKPDGKYSTKTKLYEIVSALIGERLPELKTFDLDVLVGSKCYGYIELEEAGEKNINRFVKWEVIDG